MQVEPGQNLDASSDAVSVVELKRVIELLPLETSAVAAVAPRLAVLDPPKFAALLTELARDNHAFRCLSLPRFYTPELLTELPSCGSTPFNCPYCSINIFVLLSLASMFACVDVVEEIACRDLG